MVPKIPKLCQLHHQRMSTSTNPKLVENATMASSVQIDQGNNFVLKQRFQLCPLHEAGNPDDFERQAWLSPSSSGDRVQYMERGKQSYKHEGFAHTTGTVEFPFGETRKQNGVKDFVVKCLWINKSFHSFGYMIL